jgi:hypothetical protein
MKARGLSESQFTNLKWRQLAFNAIDAEWEEIAHHFDGDVERAASAPRSSYRHHERRL